MNEDRILDQLITMSKQLGSIDERLEIYNSQLEYHIQRTDILEEQVATLRVDATRTSTTQALLWRMVTLGVATVAAIASVLKLFIY